MNKKEKILGIITAIYFVLLIAVLLMMFISIFTNVDIWLIFVYLFVILFIIGYLLIAVLKMSFFKYVCEECGCEKKLNFFEALFSRRGDNARILVCPTCQKKQLMKRQTK